MLVLLEKSDKQENGRYDGRFYRRLMGRVLPKDGLIISTQFRPECYGFLWAPEKIFEIVEWDSLSISTDPDTHGAIVFLTPNQIFRGYKLRKKSFEECYKLADYIFGFDIPIFIDDLNGIMKSLDIDYSLSPSQGEYINRTNFLEYFLASAKRHPKSVYLTVRSREKMLFDKKTGLVPTGEYELSHPKAAYFADIHGKWANGKYEFKIMGMV